MSDKQLINVKFCVKSGKRPSEILVLLTTSFCECAMKKLSVFGWQKRFKEGDDQDDPSSPTQRTDINIDRVLTFVH